MSQGEARTKSADSQPVMRQKRGAEISLNAGLFFKDARENHCLQMISCWWGSGARAMLQIELGMIRRGTHIFSTLFFLAIA